MLLPQLGTTSGMGISHSTPMATSESTVNWGEALVRPRKLQEV